MLSKEREDFFNKLEEELELENQEVLDAFKLVDRVYFVLDRFKNEAYEDAALPIGYEQTISQPTVVLKMVDALDLKPEDVVLEIGTGSAYTSAVISKMVKEVHSIEIVREIYLFAQNNIKKAEIDNIFLHFGDGKYGHPDKEKKFDKIILTAATKKVPEELFDQLKDEGILLAPIGESWFLKNQVLTKYMKDGEFIDEECLWNYSFVALK